MIMASSSKNKRLYWLAGHREAAQDVFFVEALNSSIWQEGDKDNWDTCWYTGMPDPNVFEQLDTAKTVNHIPGNNGLTIKNYLYNTLSSQKARLVNAAHQSRMDYFPHVYAMPEDYHDLQQCAVENPGKKWILKPKNSSRGRGIEIVSDIADIPMDEKWMVQEYIGNPHTMNERKYVLRLYVLVTSVDPLRVYLHDEGFAKLASEPYNIEDPDNPFAHLTNPDINATNVDSDAPVVFVSLSEYRTWLGEQGHDAGALFAKIKDLVTLTVISVREHMQRRTSAISAPTSGCYELLGVDCLVDDQLKPWILECNLSPSLEVCAGPDNGGETEKRVKGAMVADMVSLVGLNQAPPADDSLSTEQNIIRDLDDELSRAGQFERLFPNPESAEDYLSCFPIPRYADIISAKHVLGRDPAAMKFVPNHTTEIISEDELALYFETTGTLFTPNQIAGWIWLKLIDGAAPQTIIDDLIAAHTAAHGAPSDGEKWMMHDNVWEILSGWAQIGLLRPAGDADNVSPTKTPPLTLMKKGTQNKLRVGSKTLGLEYGSAALAARLAPLFPDRSQNSATHDEVDTNITVQCASLGYALSVGPRLVATGFGLDSAAQLVSRAVFEQAPAAKHDIAIAGTLVPISRGEAVLFVTGQDAPWESALPTVFAAALEQGVYGGALLDLAANTVTPIGLPLRINEDDIDGVERALDTTISPHVQNWTSGEKGRFIPSSDDMPASTYTLRHIFITTRQTGENTVPTQLLACSGHKALSALLSAAISNTDNILRGDQVSALNQWAGACELTEVVFTNPTDAADDIIKRVIKG
jgi:tubulin polyglutamylase TTLL5